MSMRDRARPSTGGRAAVLRRASVVARIGLDVVPDLRPPGARAERRVSGGLGLHRGLRLAAGLLLVALGPALGAGQPRDEGAMPRMGMPGGPMEHPPASVPFYRERTFLVLAGVALAALGVVGYRVGRRRRRRRAAPAAFTSEAVLAVDLVESTRLATHHGDSVALRARNALRERALLAAEGHRLTFAEHTGDGYLMTFPAVMDAVGAAIALLEDLRDRPPDLGPGPPLAVRAGVSYGEILLDEAGARHGAAISRAFRLEGLRADDFVALAGDEPTPAIPDRDRIVLDEEAAQELRGRGLALYPLGFCSLKGFSGLHRVYAVAWQDGAAAEAPGRPGGGAAV
jgi:class 3 adenylate cyclase